MYVQTVQTVVSTLDWKLINESDPALIEMKTDTAAMSKIMSAIVNCDCNADTLLNQNTSVVKLVKLAQVIFRYLMKCQEDLKGKCQEQEEYIQKLAKALRDSRRKAKKLLVVAQKLRRGEKCPACGRPFENASFLNSHVKRRHGYIYDAWMSIRKNEPCVVTLPKEKLQAQIDELQRKLEKVEKKQRISQQNVARVPLNPFMERPVQTQPAETSDGEIETEILDAPAPAPAPMPVPVPQVQPQPEPAVMEVPPPEPKQSLQVSTDAFEVTKPKVEASPKRKLPDSIKARAKNFLFRTSMPPVLPGQIDEIVGRITEIVHEQGRAAGFYKEDADTDEMRQEVEDDLDEHSPLPKKPVANPLKEIKKPLKRFKRKKKKLEEDSSRLKQTILGERLYGDSMPLTSCNELSDLGSEFGEYFTAGEFEPPPKILNYEISTTKTQTNLPGDSGYYYYEEEEDEYDEAPSSQRKPPGRKDTNASSKAPAKQAQKPAKKPPPTKASQQKPQGPFYDEDDYYYSDEMPIGTKPPPKAAKPSAPARRPPTKSKPGPDDYSYSDEPAPKKPAARKPPASGRKPPGKAAPPARQVPKPKGKQNPEPEYSYYTDEPPAPKGRQPPRAPPKKPAPDYSDYSYSDPFMAEPAKKAPPKGRAPPAKPKQASKWEGFRSESYDYTGSDQRRPPKPAASPRQLPKPQIKPKPQATLADDYDDSIFASPSN